MWKVIKIAGLVVGALGLFLMENKPESLRANICAWGIWDKCPGVIDSASIIVAMQIFFWVAIAAFALALIIPFIRRDFKKMEAFIGSPAKSTIPPEKPQAEADAPQQDLRIEHKFHADSGNAELVLHNTSPQHAQENVEVIFANFSIEGAPYTPIDVLSRLKARPRGTLQDTINAKDLKYYRFARVHPTQDERKYRISLWNVSEDAFSGKECIVKFRISTKQSPAKLVYLHLSVDDTGHLTVSDYERNKAKQSSTEYKPLNDAAPLVHYISLNEAARRAYEETEDTLVAGFAEMDLSNRGDKKVLSWYAWALVGKNRETPIFGKKPPSTIRRQIPADEFKRCSISDDARTLTRYFEKEPRFVELEVKETDFIERLKEIKTWNEAALQVNEPTISIQVVTETLKKIGGLTAVFSIRVSNDGPEHLEEKCLVQAEEHGIADMPDPFVLRTDGQIRNNRTGRFTLSPGQKKLVPILFQEPDRRNQFWFIGEDGTRYLFTDRSAEFLVVILGASVPTRNLVRLNVGKDWSISGEMENI